jgi:hypothetical protein
MGFCGQAVFSHHTDVFRPKQVLRYFYPYLSFLFFRAAIGIRHFTKDLTSHHKQKTVIYDET